RALAQHAGPSEDLRFGLRAGLRHERGAVHGPGAALRRLRRRGSDLDLAGVRDRAVVLDRAQTPRPARAGVREEYLSLSSSCPNLIRASTSSFTAAKTWMAGTSPAMTNADRVVRSLDLLRGPA